MVNLSNLWNNLRRSFTILPRKPQRKVKALSIKEVASDNDLWDALPLDDQIFFHCPEAKTDAVIGISSLPVEVLELILGYCNSRSIGSLVRTNRTLHSLALRKLYAHVVVYVRWHSFPYRMEAMEITKIVDYLVRGKFGALGGLLRRPEHMASLQHLEVVKLSWAAYFLHKIVQYIMYYAVSIQTLTIYQRDIPLCFSDYDGLVTSASLEYVYIHPSILGSWVASIPHTSHLRSLIITSNCAPLGRLQALGENWGSTLRHFQCIVHVENGEPDPSMEEIDQFASQFPHLDRLIYGYCDHRSTKEIPIECCARLINHLPKVISFTLSKRGSPPDDANYEYDLAATLTQVNKGLTSISVQYCQYRYGVDFIWRIASPSVLRVPNDMTGKPCLWTPDPSQQMRWMFWLHCFVVPSTARRAMLERGWPDSSIPTLLDLEQFKLRAFTTISYRDVGNQI